MKKGYYVLVDYKDACKMAAVVTHPTNKRSRFNES